MRFPQDGERGVLLFTATMTVVRNGRIQEVPFDTQSEAFGLGVKQGATLSTVPATDNERRKVRIGSETRSRMGVARLGPEYLGLTKLVHGGPS